MEIRPLPPDEAAVRRYVEELWLPYHRDLEATVAGHALADDIDLIDEELAFRFDRLESDSYRAWVAVERDGDRDSVEPSDVGTSPTDDLATVEGDLVGFVTTDVETAPSVFDRPDRLVVGDIYVHESHRGTGLARALMGRAVARARETGCGELALDVDVDNDRALAFYEKLGFETRRHRMTVPVADL